MIAVTLINTLAVFLTFLSGSSRFRQGFGIAIIILICFYAIRFNYGNDYPAYLNMFNEINSYTYIEYSTNTYDIEPGWVFLNRLFAPFGFFALVIFITVFQFGTIYWLITKYVDRNYQYIALFIYLFSSGLMLTMLSMMRQCFAMNIILLSMPFILNKKFWISVPIIVLAAQFHQSAYLMLIMPFLIYLQYLNKKVYSIFFMILFISFFVAGNMLHDIIGNTIEMYFGKYSIYFEEDEKLQLESGLGFLCNIIFFMSLILMDKCDNSRQSLFMKMAAISYLFIPLGFITPLLGRVGTYFGVLNPIGMSTIFKYSKQKLILKGVCVLYLFISLYGYFTFFYSDVFQDGFMHYHTIITESWR